MPISTSDLKQALTGRALAEGFAAVAVAPARLPDDVAAHLNQFIALGYHGDMGWMAETQTRRAAPTNLWPEARSAIVLAMNYGQNRDVFARLKDKTIGVISTYALNHDYHEVMKPKLKRLAGWLAKAASAQVKVFVDTAPLMEKPLAALAGLGWQGKHTNLVSRELGSWFFLGVILTDMELASDAPEVDHCGTCSACLGICPTKAFTAPRQIDARRCISYLTIEHKGEIPHEFRKAMGNRIYGCDDCLGICPWNKFAQAASEAKLQARADLVSPALADLLALDDAGFRKLFSGSPVKRIGRERFIRNCLIAAGNSANAGLLPHIQKLAQETSTVISEAARWAAAELGA